ncbi:hypothetical protein FB451DRAFT_1416704 [Mycena latifolia]|nr:hypothetical protein FB451DRAFT_1416704 [Mycena latifolia]
MECQTKNSLNYLEGVGQTDGEGIERTWAGLNPVGWATKEMGNGGRHDALEDKIDHHNWEKNISQGDTLARKLVVAIEERDVQVATFTNMNALLRSEVRKEWQGEVDAWNADKTKPNPFPLKGGKRSGLSEVAVHLELKKDEVAEVADTSASVHTKGTTAFLVAGMQLEETQRRIKTKLKGSRVLITDQNNHVEELRVSFASKLKAFRDVQARHIPGAMQALEEEEEGRDPDDAPPNPEDIALWIPSELAAGARTRGCVKGLGDKQAKLREAQCWNALDDLRRRLHSKRHFIQFRNSHVVGQRQATRSNMLIGQIGERIDSISTKYRQARKALVALKGNAYCEKKQLWELTPADVALDEEEEVDTRARHRLAKIGSGRFWSRNEPALSKGQTSKTKSKSTGKSGRKKLSWIWTARGGPGENEGELHEAVRVDWCKALARKVRWTEEVQLLREEMRRVMRFLEWRARWWEGQRRARGTQISAALEAGLDAYAARQADLHRKITLCFKTAWDMSTVAVIRAASREDELLAEGMASFVRAARTTEGKEEEEEGTRCTYERPSPPHAETPLVRTQELATIGLPPPAPRSRPPAPPLTHWHPSFMPVHAAPCPCCPSRLPRPFLLVEIVPTHDKIFIITMRSPELQALAVARLFIALVVAVAVQPSVLLLLRLLPPPLCVHRGHHAW